MRREIAEGCHVPGRTDRGFKTPRWSTERRCRVPLFPGDPGNKPRLLPRCAFRRSASLFSVRGRFTEPTIHAKAFAGGDDACPEKKGTAASAQTCSEPPFAAQRDRCSSISRS